MRAVLSGSTRPHAEEPALAGVSKHAVRLFRALLCVALLGLASAPAFAVNPGEQLADPVLEARARALGEELRCMVCQNQSIDDSDAPLAKDLRILVRERLTAGDSDDQVLDFLVARYGDFVLMRPRLRSETWLLWGFAPAILGFGLFGYGLWAFRARRKNAVSAPLSDEEQQRLAALLGEQEKPASRA